MLNEPTLGPISGSFGGGLKFGAEERDPTLRHKTSKKYTLCDPPRVQKAKSIWYLESEGQFRNVQTVQFMLNHTEPKKMSKVLAKFPLCKNCNPYIHICTVDRDCSSRTLYKEGTLDKEGRVT